MFVVAVERTSETYASFDLSISRGAGKTGEDWLSLEITLVGENIVRSFRILCERT